MEVSMNRLHNELEKFFYVLKHGDILKIFDFDLSMSELLLIKCIYDLSQGDLKSSADVSDIVEKIPVSAQAVSKCFRGLEEKGYIERYTNKNDRRRTEVCLTSLGMEIYEKSQRCIVEFSQNVFESFEEDEYEEMLRLIIKLRKVYTEKIDEYTEKKNLIGEVDAAI